MKPNFSDFPSVSALRFQPSKGQVYADLADELAIHDSNTGTYYGLDPVGARIWSLLIENKSLCEIREILLTEYDVDPFQLEADLAHLFEDLFNKHLIEVTADGAKNAPKSKQSISELR